MYSQETEYTQITIYYLNGQTEAFRVYNPVDAAMVEQEIQQEFRRFLDKEWWFFQLPEQTVCVHKANVLKIEIKPPMAQLVGDGVFPYAERVTTLTRAHS